MNNITILMADIHILDDRYEELFSSLSLYQKNKARRYLQKEDAYRSILSSLFINKYVGERGLTYGKFGKPAKEGMHFNASHSGNYVIFAISDKEIGLDIEKIKDRCISLKTFILGTKEASWSDVYMAWCKKESVLKCFGYGLSKIDKTPIENGLNVFEGKKVYVVAEKFGNYVISCAQEGEDDFSFSLMEETFED